jgi:hypothetical protein
MARAKKPRRHAAQSAPVEPANTLPVGAGVSDMLANIDKANAAYLHKTLYHSKRWGVTIEIRGLHLAASIEANQVGYTKKSETEREPIYDKLFPIMVRECCYVPGTDIKLFAAKSDAEINAMAPREIIHIISVISDLSAQSAEEDRKLGNDSDGTRTNGISSSSPTSSERPSRNSRIQLQG